MEKKNIRIRFCKVCQQLVDVKQDEKGNYIRNKCENKKCPYKNKHFDNKK